MALSASSSSGNASVFVWFWLLCALIIFFAALVHVNVKNTPTAFRDLLVYGKLRDKQRKWTPVQLLEVPKRWFFHFYLMGVLVNSYVVYNVTSAFLLGRQPHPFLDKLVALIQSDHVSIDAGTAILLMLMLLFQVSRRLLECLFISIYSKSTINVAHYVLGIVFYSAFPFSVLSEAPNWHTYKIHDLSTELGKWCHLPALILFLWASWHQHMISWTFAALRTNVHGEVVNEDHRIPRGGWFELVSCPHYLMELIIYLSMLLAAGFMHRTLLAVFVFVLSNQSMAAYATHEWYLSTYPAYPKNRQAILPYLF